MLAARFAARLAVPEGRAAARRVVAPILDLALAPGAAAERATQLLHGEGFAVFETREGFARGRCATDGYVGWVPAAGLGPPAPGGRAVTALAAPILPEPDIKRREIAVLPWGAEVASVEDRGDFCRLEGGGWICAAHLAPVAGDFVDQAARLVGVPYLWGGRSAWGIDCSGLVQRALAAVGIGAPRDSDMQAAWLGAPVAEEAPVVRGDLLFWPGHVAIAEGPGSLIHANAHHMAVVREPLEAAVARIAAAGGGRPSGRRRLAAGDRGWRPAA